MNPKFSIGAVITHMENTTEDSWCKDVVKTADGHNCFFGHLFDMGADEKEANELWQWFEHFYATTYMIFPVNDGENPAYPQPTPKQRLIAYLKDLRDGKTKTAYDYDREYLEGCQQMELINKQHVISKGKAIRTGE